MFMHVRVCKIFFLDTLAFSNRVVVTSHRKSEDIGVAGKEGRGLSERSRINRTPENMLESVREHIRVTFPTIDSHYCRKDTNKQYLDSYLNLKKMYKLYYQYCSTFEYTKVKLQTCRKIFNTA